GDEQVQWQFEDEVERKFLDAINTTYVATTRAEHALYLYLEMKSEDEKIKPEQNYLPVFIWDWMTNKSPNKGGSHKIELGSLSSPKKEIESESLVDIEHFERGDLKGRLKMAFEKEEFPGALSSVHLGEEMHLLLSRLLSIEDLKKLKNLNPWMQMGTDHWKKLIGLAEELINKEEAKKWFDGSPIAVHNEQELTDQNGRIFRPDRIVEFEEEFHIIDYKTGAESKKHVVQVQSYVALLQRIEEKTVKGFLLYLQPFQVIEVSVNSQTTLF
ncbi:MAG: PD-(D/E)XK nuclease family protein, partial [Flavobacteriales bacterium]